MLMPCIGIIVFSLVTIFAQPPPTQRRSTTTLEPTEPPEVSPPLGPPTSSIEPCRGDDCRPPPNIIGPVVGSLCGILAVALIGFFIVWCYFKRKTEKIKKIPITPAIKYIEQPSLYTNAISTTDNTSRIYGMSLARNDSINSHYYEKINYNERS